MRWTGRKEGAHLLLLASHALDLGPGFGLGLGHDVRCKLLQPQHLHFLPIPGHDGLSFPLIGGDAR